MVARRCLATSRILAGALALVACTSPPSPPQTSDDQRAIVNGDMTTEFATTGVLLAGANPASLVCSGTLIGCDRFLTAAHCVCDGDGPDCQSATIGAGLRVYLQHAGIVPVVGGRVHPDFSFPSNDVAVLRLSRQVTGIAPTGLASTTMPLGRAATIVGYGRSGGGSQDYGIKQTGQVVTGACPPDAQGPGFVCWLFEGIGSNTCNGDSGGPLFITRGDDVEVAGITSGGSRDDCLAGDWSYDTDVFSFRDFVIEAAGGAALGGPACGALPAVGSAGTLVTGSQGELTAGERASLEVMVPAGTAELRLTFNATDGADVDLYARANGEPSAEHNDCAAAGASSYGACVIEGPAAGTWQVLVTADDAARYQLLASVLPGGPALVDDLYQATAGVALEVEAPAGVLVNDEGEALAAELVASADHGEVTLAGDGAFLYLPATDFTGEDRFTYRAASAESPAGGATVRIQVELGAAPDAGDSGAEEEEAGCGGCATRGEHGDSVTLSLLGLALALVRRRPGAARLR